MPRHLSRRRCAGSVQQTVSATISRDMDAPLYLYVRLDKFYQNHKRYVRSTSEMQMHSTSISLSQLTACQPYDTLGGSEGVILPCGLAAWSYFNDTVLNIAVSDGAGFPAQAITMDSSRLVWESDRSGLFGNMAPINHNTVPARRGGGALKVNLSQDENFMAWMKKPVQPGAPCLAWVYSDVRAVVTDVLAAAPIPPQG